MKEPIEILSKKLHYYKSTTYQAASWAMYFTTHMIGTAVDKQAINKVECLAGLLVSTS